MRFLAVFFLVLLWGVTGISAQQDDPIAQWLIPPHVIVENARQIGLTAEQVAEVRAAAEDTRRAVQSHQNALETAVGALSRVLQEDEVVASTAQKRFDSVLDAERPIKHLHLEMLIKVNHLLDERQRTALRQHMAAQRKSADLDALEKNLKAKLKQVERGMQARVRTGEHPFEIAELMQSFPKLMEQGKHTEAEGVLDRAIKLLGDGDSQLEKEDHAPPAKPSLFKSPEELKTEVAAMRVKDIEWRQIQWKTCLLEGIKASKDQKKPMILWVFIDRPVDDKRC